MVGDVDTAGAGSVGGRGWRHTRCVAHARDRPEHRPLRRLAGAGADRSSCRLHRNSDVCARRPQRRAQRWREAYRTAPTGPTDRQVGAPVW